MNKKLNIKSKSLIILIVTILMIASTVITTFAAVDLAGGIEHMASQVTKQGKAVATVVFGVLALGCLIFTVVKGIKAFMSYKKNQDYETMPVVLGGIATIVASLCATSTFFGWFGLN